MMVPLFKQGIPGLGLIMPTGTYMANAPFWNKVDLVCLKQVVG
jgi:hypothetical protein